MLDLQLKYIYESLEEKKIIIILFLMILISCSGNQLNTQDGNISEQSGLGKNHEIFKDEIQVKEQKIDLVSKKNISLNETEKYNIRKELKKEKCDDMYKFWDNKTYGFSICIPDDWYGISSYGYMKADFHDYLETIGKYNTGALLSIENSSSIIGIASDDRSDIFDFHSYGISETKVTSIVDNRIFIDGFERTLDNKLSYINSFLILKSGDKISSFIYDKNNKVHVHVIKSIKKLD